MLFRNPTFDSKSMTDKIPVASSSVPLYENQPVAKNPARSRSQSFGEQKYDKLAFPQYFSKRPSDETYDNKRLISSHVSRKKIFSFGFNSISAEPRQEENGLNEGKPCVECQGSYSYLHGNPRYCLCSRLIVLITVFLLLLLVLVSGLKILHVFGVFGAQKSEIKIIQRTGINRRCASSPCRNGAKCLDLESDYICLCPSGWTGYNCSTREDTSVAIATKPADIDDCASSPCKNGGTCVDLVNNYACLCTEVWEGKNCTKNIDDCASRPCKNGGTCIDLVNSYACLCTEVWGGKNCTKSTVGLPSACWRMNKTYNGVWNQSSIFAPDAIDFSMNIDCYLFGYLLWGPFSRSGSYSINLLVKDEEKNVIGESTRDINTSSITYEVSFPTPVLIRANRWYTAAAHVVGPPTHIGWGGEEKIECNGWTARFKSSNASRNGTDVSQGQIPALLLA